MASNPITEYQTALRNFNRAKNHAETLVNTIAEAAAKLQNWRTVRVSNVNVGFPVDISISNSINANQWPTAQQLAEALADYHSRLHEVGNAYRRIPEDQREVVQPPPAH